MTSSKRPWARVLQPKGTLGSRSNFGIPCPLINPPEIIDEVSSKVDFATDHFVMEYLFPNLDVNEWGELIKKRFALPTAM